MTETELSATRSAKWALKGVQTFGANLGESVRHVSRAAAGDCLTLSERNMISTTGRDCLKLAPLIVIWMAPFGSILLPVVTSKCSWMLPSTFSKPQCDDGTIAPKLDKKRDHVQGWQHQIVASQMTALHKFNLSQPFQRMSEFLPTVAGVLRMREVPWFQAAHICQHMKKIRDGHFHLNWEGVEVLSRMELIASCKARAIPFHGLPDSKTAKHLNRWVQLSSNENISMSLHFWSRRLQLHNA